MNPSQWCQRILISLIAAVALFIALYMGLYQWRLIGHAFDPVFGSQTKQVLDSDVSHEITRLILIPDSILGVLAYLGDILFALAGSSQRWRDRPWLVILFGIDVIPLGLVSGTLIALQGVIVDAWCFLCIITAVISFVLIFLAYGEVKFCLDYLVKIWRATKSKRVLWNAFWGTPTEETYRIAKEMIGVDQNS